MSLAKKILILFFVLINVANAQTTFLNEEIIHEILEKFSNENENSHLIEILEYYQLNPININKTSKNELANLPFLSDNFISQIINVRDKNDGFNNLDEIITQFQNFSELKYLLPFIVFENRFYEKSIFTDLSLNKFEFRSRIENQFNSFGNEQNDYLGNKLKSYNRIKLSLNNKINFGSLIEKDPGEKSYNDFTSYFISIENYNFLNKLIIGNYLIEFGQGLALWSPYSTNKSSEVITKIKSRNLIPYTSTDENNYFRGIATSISLNYFDLISFYSNKKIDVSYNEENLVTSFRRTGYHRNINEINNENNLSEKSFGIILSKTYKNNILSFLYFNQNFSSKIIFDEKENSHKNNFSFYSFSFIHSSNLFNIKNEFSLDKNSFASINTVILHYKLFSFITSYRNYSYKYYSIYANGFGESQNTRNEIGLYTGIEVKTKLRKLKFYYDQFKFPTGNSQTKLPLFGKEFLIEFENTFSKSTSLKLRYTFESKEILTNFENNYLIGNQNKNKFRIELSQKIWKKLQIKSRIEFSKYSLVENNSNENGILIYQDFVYSPTNILKFYTRITFYDTESYNSRIYQFENDILGVFSNQAFYGEGFKIYFLMKLKIQKQLTLSLKYFENYKYENLPISEIEKNKNPLSNKISLQLDYKL